MALTSKVIIIKDEKLVCSKVSHSMVHYVLCACFSSVVIVEVVFELVKFFVLILIILSVLWLVIFIHVYQCTLGLIVTLRKQLELVLQVVFSVRHRLGT